jgi:uncharacterized LabA/DUF88 family protein
MFYRDERLALFIDGPNLHSAIKALGFEIDYKLLLSEFMRRGEMVRAFYYTALLEKEEYSAIRPLVDWLDYNGFTLVTKPAKVFIDASGRRKIKGNMDIELAVDAMEMADHVEHIVLFSGDGDFRPLVAALQRKGVRVSVVSTIRSSPPMIADVLRRQADNFIELEELKDVIGRPPRPVPVGSDIVPADEGLERAREEIRQRPPPPATSEETLDTENTLTLSPRMKEALAFVATEDPAEKKLERPHAASLEALERRGLIILSSTDYDCSLTEKGRRAFEAIRSG